MSVSRKVGDLSNISNQIAFPTDVGIDLGRSLDANLMDCRRDTLIDTSGERARAWLSVSAEGVALVRQGRLGRVGASKVMSGNNVRRDDVANIVFVVSENDIDPAWKHAVSAGGHTMNTVNTHNALTHVLSDRQPNVLFIDVLVGGADLFDLVALIRRTRRTKVWIVLLLPRQTSSENYSMVVLLRTQLIDRELHRDASAEEVMHEIDQLLKTTAG